MTRYHIERPGSKSFRYEALLCKLISIFYKLGIERFLPLFIPELKHIVGPSAHRLGFYFESTRATPARATLLIGLYQPSENPAAAEFMRPGLGHHFRADRHRPKM